MITRNCRVKKIFGVPAIKINGKTAIWTGTINQTPHFSHEKWGVWLNNPAATYSPTQLPVQYHRPREA